jgi:hypothetical protein
MDVAKTIFYLLLARRYDLTDHAIDSMDDDGLTFGDILACAGRGRLRRAWPRQRKYEIEGQTLGGCPMRIIARLLGAGKVRIITVYEVR